MGNFQSCRFYILVGAATLTALAVGRAMAEEPVFQPAPYCSDLKRITALATTKEKFASITGKPRDGDFLETSLPLTGWKDCALYGSSTYTCDSQELTTAEAAEMSQAETLRDIKACLGQGWSEAADQSSPSYVVLHNAARPISITLSTDETDNKKHLVHLILFIRRN
jgi:hypothetical protein